MKCPECGSGKMAFSMSEVSCGKCGLVIDDQKLVAAY